MLYFTTLYTTSQCHACVQVNGSKMKHSRLPCLLRRPESNRLPSGYEPDELPMLYPAMNGSSYHIAKKAQGLVFPLLYIEKFLENLLVYIDNSLCFMFA